MPINEQIAALLQQEQILHSITGRQHHSTDNAIAGIQDLSAVTDKTDDSQDTLINMFLTAAKHAQEITDSNFGALLVFAFNNDETAENIPALVEKFSNTGRAKPTWLDESKAKNILIHIGIDADTDPLVRNIALEALVRNDVELDENELNLASLKIANELELAVKTTDAKHVPSMFRTAAILIGDLLPVTSIQNERSISTASSVQSSNVMKILDTTWQWITTHDDPNDRSLILGVQIIQNIIVHFQHKDDTSDRVNQFISSAIKAPHRAKHPALQQLIEEFPDFAKSKLPFKRSLLIHSQ